MFFYFEIGKYKEASMLNSETVPLLQRERCQTILFFFAHTLGVIFFKLQKESKLDWCHRQMIGFAKLRMFAFKKCIFLM